MPTSPSSPLSTVIQNLRADLRPDGEGITDGEFLTRFVRSRDEEALAGLVQRHALMVWGVCRRLLNHHDAEDAFQATFLVLVRKASDVPRQAVANWLYGVARQTAVRMRATAAKNGRREAQVVSLPERPVPEIQDADWPLAVDEELSRLSDRYRSVLVLCDLEGMTRKEAARQLDIPEGSVASRLARARALLAKRLNQKGIVLSGSVASLLPVGSMSASAPPALVMLSIKVASLYAAGQAAGITATVITLADGAVKAMFMTKIKSVLAAVLVVASLVGTAGFVSITATAQGDQPPSVEKPVNKTVSLENKDLIGGDPPPNVEKQVPPAAKEEKPEKGSPISWGKEVDGLQAGVRLRPGEPRVFRHGETIMLVVHIRNVGKQTVKFQYFRKFLDENPPDVTHADDKTVPQPHGIGIDNDLSVTVSLEPGKEIELKSKRTGASGLRYELRPANGERQPTAKEQPLFVGTGKVSIQFKRVFPSFEVGLPQLPRSLSSLATGKLELEIKEAVTPPINFPPEVIGGPFPKLPNPKKDDDITHLRQPIITVPFISKFPLPQPAEKGRRGPLGVAVTASGKEVGVPCDTFAGHQASVYSVAFSPDGKTLASGSEDKTIILWDVKTGTKTTLAGHTKTIWSVAFSPDGKTLASGSEDKTIKLWDVKTGKLTATVEGRSEPIYCVAFSPDGKTLASASGVVKFWDVTTGKNTDTFGGEWSGFVAFSPDGKKLVELASGDIRLWDLATRKNTVIYQGQRHLRIGSMALSPNGWTVAGWELGPFRSSVKLWDVKTGKETGIQSATSHTCVAFTPNSAILATCGGHSIQLSEVFTGKLLTDFKGDGVWVGGRSLAFSPDGKILAAGGIARDFSIKVWRMENLFDEPAAK